MRIGVRAHDFGKLPAEELAARIAAQGLTCVQLALSKAIAGIQLQRGQLNPGLAFHVGQAFQRHGIQIAVLGCYVNPIHPDPVTRAGLLELFKEHLRFARDFGCSVVALETGSVDPDYAPHPANGDKSAFRDLVGSLSTLAAEAERFGVMVGIEGVTTHVVSTPRKMRQVIEAIGSNNVQVVFDPVNLISPANFQEQRRIVDESFELFGDRIVVIHAKDFLVEGAALKQVRTGRGQFDHRYLVGVIQQAKPGISVLLEEVDENSAAGCARFLNSFTPPA